MTVNDPVYLAFDEKRKFWYLMQGRETFYDTDRAMCQWENLDDAIKWSEDYLGQTPLPAFDEIN